VEVVMKIPQLVFLAWSLAALAGCVEQTSYETPDESDRVGKLLLSELPDKLDRRIGADFDGKVILHGCDLDATSAEPDGYVNLVWYWECKQPPGPGWRLFTHVLDSEGRSRVNRDKSGPIRKHFQPEHWRAGMLIEDIQRIKIPKKWPYDALELRIGLWRGEERMKVVSGPVDGQGRVKGPRVAVRAGRPIEVRVPRAASKPVIDGVFQGEEVWRGAARLDAFGHTITGDAVAGETDVRLLWGDTHLYVAMSAEDEHLQSKFEKHDDELWHEDVFEVFLDPRGDKKHYYEIQVSPAGIVFDSHLRSYRKNRNEWSSEVETAVKRDGTLGEPGDVDRGWSAELAIPFAAMTEGGGVPPAAGDVWRANFFRVDVTEKKPVYSGWSPPLRGDFHALDRFGAMVFEAPAEPEPAVDGGAPVASPGDAGPASAPAPGAPEDKTPREDKGEK
jgi:hypothetical protein